MLTPEEQMQILKEAITQGSNVPVFKLIDQANIQKGQIAQTESQQSQGLKESDGNTTMAFPESKDNFTTEGMEFPIDVRKYDREGNLVRSYDKVPPGIKELNMGNEEGTVIETPSQYQNGGVRNTDNVSAIPEVMIPEINIEEKDPRSWAKKTYQNYISPIGHTVLDVAGMVPGLGEPVDLVNAAWYAGEGNYTDAALTSAAAIPFVGWGATTAKWGKNTIKAMDKVTPGGGDMYKQLKNLNDVNPKLAKELKFKNNRQIKKMIKNDPTGAQKIIDDANSVTKVKPNIGLKEGKQYDFANKRFLQPEALENTNIYRKTASDRTHPVRGGHSFSDIAGEYTWLDDASKISDKVVAPFNPKFSKSGDMLSFDLHKYDDYTNLSTFKSNHLRKTGRKWAGDEKDLFKSNLTNTMTDLQNKGFHHMDMHSGNVLVKGNEAGKILDYKIIDPVGYTHDFQKSEMFLKNNPEFQDWDGILKNRNRVNDDLFRIKNEFRRGGLRQFKKGGVRQYQNGGEKDTGYHTIDDVKYRDLHPDVSDAIDQVDAVYGGKALLTYTAIAESTGGWNPKAGQNYFQIMQSGLDAVKDVKSHPKNKVKLQQVKDKFGIDLANISLKDVRTNPLANALVARLYYMNDPNPAPTTVEGIGKYWSKYYNTSADVHGTPEYFNNAVDEFNYKSRVEDAYPWGAKKNRISQIFAPFKSLNKK